MGGLLEVAEVGVGRLEGSEGVAGVGVGVVPQ